MSSTPAIPQAAQHALFLPSVSVLIVKSYRRLTALSIVVVIIAIIIRGLREIVTTCASTIARNNN
jgi:hypothetical protein